MRSIKHELPDQLEDEVPVIFEPQIEMDDIQLEFDEPGQKQHFYRGKAPPFLKLRSEGVVIRLVLKARET